MVMSSEQMLKKFTNDTSHPLEVQKFALTIFDSLNETLNDMDSKHREMLEAAALLHDIGYHIDSKNHNKHSQKLILKYGLENFSENQKKIISCVARYHRGSLPDKDEHDVYCTLDKKERKIVKRLGGILRIADGLSHIRFIKNFELIYDDDNNINEFVITPMHIDYKPDIEYLIKKKNLFEIGFKTQAVFKFKSHNSL